jgi:hypothetical protein
MSLEIHDMYYVYTFCSCHFNSDKKIYIHVCTVHVYIYTVYMFKYYIIPSGSYSSASATVSTFINTTMYIHVCTRVV